MTPSSLEQVRRRVRHTAGALELAVATGRRELAERGLVSPDVWEIIDAQAEELVEQLGALELAERQAPR